MINIRGARASFFPSLALFFSSNTAGERVELLWITSTYLVGMNESGNQKGNLSYLADTKKRSDCLIQLIFHKRWSAAGKDARAIFLSNTAEERVETICVVSVARVLPQRGTFAKFRSRSHAL